MKIRGYRIELGEIEARLRACMGVREAVVLAREDTPGERRLVAYLTCNASGVEVEQVRAQLLSKLPEYMVPAAYVLLASLPLTPNGKLAYEALPAPQAEAYERGEYEAPQGQIEQALAEIWQQLLPVERIGRHDNFFQLGGYSLLALKLMGCIAERFGTQVPVYEVFRKPTVEQMAQCVGTLLLQSEKLTALECSEYEQGVI